MRVLLAVDGSPHSQLAVDAVAERPWPDGTTRRRACRGVTRGLSPSGPERLQ
jgi:hypothetical protein